MFRLTRFIPLIPRLNPILLSQSSPFSRRSIHAEDYDTFQVESDSDSAINVIEAEEADRAEIRRLERLERQRILQMGDTDLEREEQEALAEEQRQVDAHNESVRKIRQQKRMDEKKYAREKKEAEMRKAETGKIAGNSDPSEINLDSSSKQEVEEMIDVIKEDKILADAFQNFKKSLTDDEILEVYGPKSDNFEFKKAIMKKAGYNRIPNHTGMIDKAYKKMKKPLLIKTLKEMIQDAEETEQLRMEKAAMGYDDYEQEEEDMEESSEEGSTDEEH